MTFTFRSTEDQSGFQCRLDAGAWATCQSPYRLPDQAPGLHTLDVRAVDAAGNTDEVAVSRAYRIRYAFSDMTSQW